MNADLAAPTTPLPCYQTRQIEFRLRSCPRLPSLGSVNSALRELLSADHRYTAQIAEIIRRDPSLTERLLRLVNSVYYGFSTPIQNIEEAVFFLGVRQIRQLALMTPIIDDFQRLAGKTPFDWRRFWQHCIATALLTREVGVAFDLPGDETEYVAGLVHDVGKIAMAAVFPDHFVRIQALHRESRRDLLILEREVLGIDHAELGALYLGTHRLPEVLVEAARYHHRPREAARHRRVVAAVEIADHMVRLAGIGHSGNEGTVQEATWLQTAGWRLLSEAKTDHEKALIESSLRRLLDRLPAIVEGLV